MATCRKDLPGLLYCFLNTPLSAAESSSSATLTRDAMLGLERLITGRDCNGFDRLSPARKARAFAELIRLGYV